MKDRDYLAHVQKAIQEIREILAGLDREAYENDVKAQRALERELQIIGDAVHRLSPEFVAQHPTSSGARSTRPATWWSITTGAWTKTSCGTSWRTNLEDLGAKVSALLRSDDLEP